MTDNEIREAIGKAIRGAVLKKHKNIALSDDLDLRGGLGIDSMGFVLMASTLERELNVNIEKLALKLPEIQTVGDMHACVAELRGS